MGFAQTALLAFLLAAKVFADLPPIVKKGQHFFYENGTQFFIKGIAYQEDGAPTKAKRSTGTYIDPLSDETTCKRDVPVLAAAGTNTIRTYAIDPTKDHSACMKLLQDHGIYVISDLSEPFTSINRDQPKWNVDLWNRYKAVVDELSKYDNVIGFFAGNEVSNNVSNTDASAYVKAAVRDVRAYIAGQSKRWIGVGYASNDDADIRMPAAQYFVCGNQSHSIDFWGYNIYSWCGSSSFTQSGFDVVVKNFTDYPVPMFYAEYGCNNEGAEKRQFSETTELYSTDMIGQVSGGIVYKYFQDVNNYGLVTVVDENTVTPFDSYKKLAARVLAASPKLLSMNDYNPTSTSHECPSVVANQWKANGDSLPPTPDASLCDCMYQSVTCVPSSSISADDYGELFSSICGLSSEACAGISGNTTTGVYGSFSMCNSTHQLAYVASQYVKINTGATCDFNGKMKTKSSTVASSCSGKLASANAVNSAAATATAAITDGGSSRNFAVSSKMGLTFTFGGFAVGFYALTAMAIGGVMVLF